MGQQHHPHDIAVLFTAAGPGHRPDGETDATVCGEKITTEARLTIRVALLADAIDFCPYCWPDDRGGRREPFELTGSGRDHHDVQTGAGVVPPGWSDRGHRRRALIDRGPSGRFGRRGLPLLALFGVVLPVLAPVVDILLVYGLLFLNRVETAAFWLAMLALQTLAAVLAFRLDREPLRPLWSLPLQQFVYRQLMYLVLIHAVISALTGIPQRWQRLHRTGQVARTDQPAPAPP